MVTSPIREEPGSQELGEEGQVNNNGLTGQNTVSIIHALIQVVEANLVPNSRALVDVRRPLLEQEKHLPSDIEQPRVQERVRTAGPDPWQRSGKGRVLPKATFQQYTKTACAPRALS